MENHIFATSVFACFHRVPVVRAYCANDRVFQKIFQRNLNSISPQIFSDYVSSPCLSLKFENSDRQRSAINHQTDDD